MVAWNFAARAWNHRKSDKEFVEAGSSWCRDLLRVVRLIAPSTSDFSSVITSFTSDFRASVSVIALLWGLGCAQPSMAQLLPAGTICKSEQCLRLPHPDNRRIGTRARFVDTMTDRHRLPTSLDN